MEIHRPQIVLTLTILVMTSWGCHHQIVFEDIAYKVDTPKQDIPLLVVIDSNTLNHVAPIKSWMTGIAHSWDAKPGEMLKQVADVEFPQMFNAYTYSPIQRDHAVGERHLTLILTIPHYAFSDFHALVTVRAQAYENAQLLLFDKSYTKEGIRQGGKMFWGGAFAMKSAIRQSSFDAYKKVFENLRNDLNHALHQ